MARYRVAITLQVSSASSVAAARLRALRPAEVKELSADMLRVVIDRHGRDARCAARRAFDDINRVLAGVTFTRPPVWTDPPARLARTDAAETAVGSHPAMTTTAGRCT